MTDLPVAPVAPGETRPIGDGRERYLAHLVGRGRCAARRACASWSDCANGAASGLAPALLRRLGRRGARDQRRARRQEHQRRVRRAVPRGRGRGGRCGSAPTPASRYDGDADRALFADAEGAIVDGDQVLAACALAMHERGDARRRTRSSRR